jgi:5-methylcytosine-specific restriction endonuclease McrA
MNLKNLSDQALLNETDRLAKQSRQLLLSLLHHLREIERRRLFSALKCESLFDYVVKHLKFSEGEANRRISAMRMIREVPEIEEKIVGGSLTLSTVVMARVLFGKEEKAGRPMGTQAKAQVMNKLENQSAREAQKYLSSINPEMKRTKELTFDLIEDETLRKKLLQVKGLLAHSHPNMSLSEMLHRWCDQELAKKTLSRSASPTSEVKRSKAETNRQIWRRDQAKCINCSSTYALERDHIRPRSTGGPDTLENQRLLCRSCNQRAAIEYFGERKMESFLKSSVTKYG